MGWKALAWACNTPIPLVAVTSESMEPGFRRGDILLLWNHQSHVRVGDIPVLWFQERQLPMVSVQLQTQEQCMIADIGRVIGTSGHRSALFSWH